MQSAMKDNSQLQQTLQQLDYVKSRLPEDPLSDHDQGGCIDGHDLLQQLDQLAPGQPHTVPDEVAHSTFMQNLDILVANGFDVNSPHEVVTHGLYVQAVGQRSLRVEDLSAPSILAEIRRVWYDIPHPFTAILVRPSTDERMQINFIVEFLDFHRLPAPETKPTLRTIIDADLAGPIVQAAYHVGEVQPHLLVGQAQLRHKCRPWNDRRCDVRLNDQILSPLSCPRIEEGDRLEFRVHQQEEPEEEDTALSLMQRSSSRSPRRELPPSTSTDGSGPDLLLVHTFHMSAAHKLVHLDKSRPLSYTAQLEENWRFPLHTSITGLHEVRHPPQDLESTSQATLLIEGTVDLHRQALTDDQLVLADVVLSGAGGTADQLQIRRVVWTRRHDQTCCSPLVCSTGESSGLEPA